MKTVIMAGGLGKRIQELDSTIPKPLISIAGKPILRWEIECLVKQGFTDIILTVSHMADKIQYYFKDGAAFNCNIDYFLEEKPLGNAGALFKLWEAEKLNGDFLLLNADSMFDVDLKRFIAFHEEHKALATLFTHPNNHPCDSTLIVANEETKVIEQWLTKEDKRPEYYKNCVNAGIHIINAELLKLSNIKTADIDSEHKVDLDRDLLKPLITTNRIFAYSSPEYIKDMGTPERLKQVTQDLISGKVQARNLTKKQKAIFLDRDGTINKDVGFLTDINDFELLPGVAEAIKRIKDSEYLCIVVTNQPVIARGEVTLKELRAIHNKMETLLGEQGAYIDGLYYCPHHPDKGFEGEIPELKIDCDCRKPKPGMLLQAAKDYNIDLSKSWMIGDSEKDIEAGKNAGCTTILIVNSENQIDSSTADWCVDSLLKAVKLIQVLARTDLSSIREDAKYILLNTKIQRPLSLFDNYNNSKVIEEDFATVLDRLIKQPNPEDFIITTWEEFSKMEHISLVPAEGIPKLIEYHDHYLMALDEQDCSCSVTFDAYFQYLLNGGFDKIEAYLLESFNLSKWNACSPENMIASMLFKNETDYNKKIKAINYYNAHGKCAMQVLRKLYSKERYDDLKATPRIVRNTYYKILRRILLELDQLVNLYNIQVENNPKYPATVRPPVHIMSFHNLLRQSIYGNYSLDSFADYEPANAIAVIRQLIELRIRKAIGIMGYIDGNGNPVTLGLSDIFDILKKYSDIIYPVKLENIIRIYKWANYYIHSGRSDWSWISIFIEEYLRDFSFGVWKRHSWSYKNALKIPQNTLAKIKQDVKNKRPDLNLFECEPECEILQGVLISIIVPVYNVKPYLECCIKSVLVQTYTNWECILVDDGSTDGSDAICDKYAGLDKRIKCIHKKNGGLSDARNAGIEAAIGQYLFFLDGDDYILPNTLAVLLEKAEKFSADLVVGVFDTSDKYSSTSATEHLAKTETKYLVEDQVLDFFFETRKAYLSVYSVCGKLWRKEIFTEIRFPVGKLHEDVFVAYKLWDKAKKAVIYEQVVYIYRTVENSITRSSFNIKRLDIIEAFFEQLHYFQEKKSKYIDYTWNYLLGAFYDSYKKGKKSGCFEDAAFCSRYLDLMKQFKNEWKEKTGAIRKKTKLKVNLFLLSPRIFYFVFDVHVFIKSWS